MDKISNILPSISEIIKRYKLTPNKKLGQNFILDTDITDRIVLSAGNLKGVNVLEIGSGAGTLTRSLLASNAEKIVAVEMDVNCIKALETLIAANVERLKVVQGDALKIKEEEIIGYPAKVIANLPYNIGTELVLKWIIKTNLFKSITVMLQKEVVERMSAMPSTAHYGRLSIICQLLCEVEKKFDVEAHHFYPPPKVTSSIVTITPRKEPLYNANISKVEKMTQILFSQRRKMVRSILKNKVQDLESMLEELNINPLARPENLTLKNFCDLGDKIIPL
ncbi:16S rRNA (adenine(1518)-N(6)/adenine(1519)-N(6))-dimethyltransferase RsmA [Holosporaceae bacterium 'Namur']|nr:16S rRNA (adenine(1518)-N(6)/adenine(1519)-N(6))-dimethyltransferase RsmA [Holosporaceae bacterium 'Namur']